MVKCLRCFRFGYKKCAVHSRRTLGQIHSITLPRSGWFMDTPYPTQMYDWTQTAPVLDVEAGVYRCTMTAVLRPPIQVGVPLTLLYSNAL